MFLHVHYANTVGSSNIVNGRRVLYKVKRMVNDINTQFCRIDGFEVTTKNLTMGDIKVIFEKMLKEHEASVVQDSLSKDVNDLKESLEFSENEYDKKFKNMGDNVQK